MPALTKIEVIEKEDRSVVLRILIIHPDETEFYEEQNYALQLLWEAGDPRLGIKCSLTQAISYEQIRDKAWVVVEVMEYIEKSKITSTKNYPPPADISNEDYENINEEKIPSALLSITVTDKKWIEHLRVGLSWESAAYNYLLNLN